jgi:uncharacterized protein YwqG
VFYVIEELTSKLESAGLAEHAGAIRKLARPSVRIEGCRRNQDTLTIGASRFGGVPDLPPDFVWPHYEGRPLAFLCQLNLSEMPRTAGQMPHAGFLAFFYETESMKWGFAPGDRGCSHVAFFTTPSAELTRTSTPHASPLVETFHSCSLQFETRIDLPDREDLIFEPLDAQLSDESRDAYHALTSASHGETYHHIFGHAQLIQSDMRLECALASNGVDAGTPEGFQGSESRRPGAVDWELLLQIDTDEEGPGWMWGDVGRLYFWLRKDDLVARRFEKAWLVLQCC